MGASAEARLIIRKLAALGRAKLDTQDALDAIDSVLAGRRGLSTSKRLEAARKSRRNVLKERNMALLWAIAASGVTAHIIEVDDPGDWDKVLCIHTTDGQMHWKLGPDDQADFAVKRIGKAKDDHNEAVTPDEKKDRLAKMHTIIR